MATGLMTTTYSRAIAACLIASACIGFSDTSNAAPILDGNITVGEYGAGPTAAGFYNATAPEGNFQSATPFTRVGYSIYQTSASGYYFGAVQVTTPNPAYGPTGIVGTFANLYFDLDPNSVPGNGSDLGFEIGVGQNNQRVFVPGIGSPIVAAGIMVMANAAGTVLEYAIPVSYFTGPVAGLSYDPDQKSFPSSGETITLRLSQSFSYSVAGGPDYGPNRLGSVTLDGATAVPEPASLALLGAGLVALGLRKSGRYRRGTSAA